MVGSRETSWVGLASLASVMVGGSLGGGAVIGTPVGDTGETSAKSCSVDKVGALGLGSAEDDNAEVWAKPKTTNIYFTTRTAGGEN